MRLSRRRAKRQQRFAEWMAGELAQSQREAEALAKAAAGVIRARSAGASKRALERLKKALARYETTHRNLDEFCLE